MIMPLNIRTKYHKLVFKRNSLFSQQNKVLIKIEQKYNLPQHYITEDDNADGLRNGGLGSTDVLKK